MTVDNKVFPAIKRAVQTPLWEIWGGPRPPRKFRDLADHYRLKELGSENDERKSYSTKEGYKSYLTNWIVPCWGEYFLNSLEGSGIAIRVEDSVPYAHLSVFFLIWSRRALFNSEQLPRLHQKMKKYVVDRPHCLIPNAKTAAHF
jgi:hypothetical protein